jgi:glycosyltransferase involved in cell wall biosynthesis
MYKILCSAMGYDGGKSGISAYMNEVIAGLSEDHCIHLLILESEIENFPLQESKNLKFIIYSDFYAKPLINMLWHLFFLPFTLNFKDYDFIYLPAGNRRLFCRNKIPTLVTFHDLSQFHIEAKYDKFRMAYIKKIIPYFLKKVDRIIAISESTKKDIVHFYKIDESKISTNHNGFDGKLYKSLSGEREFIHLPVKKKYIFYVARIEHPGKNHLNLIKAYELLPKNLKDEYQLICAGSSWNGADEVYAYAQKSPDAKNIHFTGFVDFSALPSLYKEASLYAFPSLYEGFGIPLLEAMGSGVPVVCSDRSSLPEIGGDAVLLFNPDEPEDICHKMQQVISDNGLKEQMISKGLERAKNFTWSRHCKQIIEEFEGLKKT